MDKLEEKDFRRSEEIQDIIDRMPTGWTRYVTSVIAIFMSILMAFGCLIKYPDTVVGQITITSTDAPVRLLAAGTGRLHLLCHNRDSVETGDVIAYIDDGAVLADILILDSLLSSNDSIDPDNFPTLLLGSLSPVYDTWVAACQNLNQVRSTGVYNNMRRNLDEQMDVSHSMARIQEIQLNMNEEQLQVSRLRLYKDSLLHREGAISDEELEHKRSSLISQEVQLIERRSGLLTTQSNISKSRIERARIDITEIEELRRAKDNLAVREAELHSALRQWKERNLITALVRGRVEFLGFWRENEFIQAGQVLFSVLPPKGAVFGEAHVTVAGFGKVEVGQAANVKLTNFPYEEFGHVKGCVKSISHLTQTIQTSQEAIETYLVIIAFPNGMVTNYGQLLDVGYEAHGQVEIVTKPKRIIQRLFDNLKSRKEK